jgi:Mrp family chromosome partitioning ATPase/capsular polysaccharide biosynthesis protein
MAFDLAGVEHARSAGAEQPVGPYLRAVRRHWLLVAVVALLAAAAAAYTVSRAGRSYEASASILVTPLPAGNSSFLGIGTVVDTGDPARTVQTAAALIDTPDAAALAARELGRGFSAQGVLSAVSVTPRGASDVLAITARATSPTDATRIANAFAASAIAYRASVVQRQIVSELVSLQARLATLKGTAGSAEAGALAATVAQLQSVRGPGREPTMSVSQTAQTPSGPTGPATWLIVALALAGGLALGGVGALALETFTRPIHEVDELTSLYPLPVLASVPLMRRWRRRDFGPSSFSPRAFEQIRMLRVQLSLREAGSVIMLTSAGAGDGKTTVAAALAAAFSEVEEEVILIDLDLRKRDLGRLLGVPEARGQSLRDGETPTPLPIPGLSHVRVIPAPKGDLATYEAFIRRLPDVLEQARRSASYVILDTAPVGEVSETLRISQMCDQVVVVVRPRHTERRRVSIARDLLERANAPTVGMVIVGEEAGGGGYYGYGYSPATNGERGETDRSGLPARGFTDGSDKEHRALPLAGRRRIR